MNTKEIIRSCALELGFQRVVIASLEPMQAERLFFENWLAQGYAATMGYLTRNPEKRTSPQLLAPDAYSAIIVFASYYTEAPQDPGAEFGRVARYAVGQDYHVVLPEKLAMLKSRIEEKLGKPILGKYFTDDVELYEQALAAKSGLGFSGKNTMIIGPKLMGSYHFVAEFFTDLQIEPDEPYQGTCGSCFRCGSACPTDAIVREGEIDSRLCISFLTIENKIGIPIQLREKMGSWVFGCDVCQEVCPYNQKPPVSQWNEFQPASGAGHFINLYDVLNLKGRTEYMNKFAQTPLSRPKRFGLQRNALIVVGNRKPDDGLNALSKFLHQLPEEFSRGEMRPGQIEILFEHACWALSRYSGATAEIGKARHHARSLLTEKQFESLDLQFAPYL
jgi:epoxyqueuosine reductase